MSRGYILMASLESTLMRTKRCQAERSPWVSAFSLRRKLFLNLRISLTCMLVLRGSGGGVGEEDIFKFVAAGRQNGGSLVYLGGIEQVEHGKMLHGEHFVHAFEAQAALPVQEVGDVGLLEFGLLGESKAGQFAGIDALPENLAKIILQDFELHGPEYSTGL